jgi:hypothetical protein
LDIEKKIRKGDEVAIQIGYDEGLKMEFKGYLNAIATENGNIILRCEDAMYLSRKPMKSAQLSNVSVKELLDMVASVMGGGIRARTNYNRTWDKFVLDNTNGRDVLQKIQDECRLNIYVLGDELVAEPADTFHSNKKVKYDFAKNIEKSELKYRNADEREFEVIVEGLDKNGTRKTVTIGKEGGEKRKVIVTAWKDEADLKRRGEEEMKHLAYDGYEGSITAWLIPYVEPGYAATLHDADYEYRNGTYYVPAVTTEISASGGVRKVQIGRKLN